MTKIELSYSAHQPVVESALILCGGKGTRLASSLPNVQKCCAPLGPTNPLEIIFRRLRLIGVERFFFLTGHLAPETEAIIKRFTGNHAGVTTLSADPDQSTGQTIESIRDLIPNEFIYHHGNLMLADYHYGKLLQEYGATQRTTLLVCDNNKNLTHPVVGLETTGRISEVGRHNLISNHFSKKSSVGVGVYKKEDIDNSASSETDLTTEQCLRPNDSIIMAVDIDNNWIHIENSEDYQDAQMRYMRYAT